MLSEIITNILCQANLIMYDTVTFKSLQFYRKILLISTEETYIQTYGTIYLHLLVCPVYIQSLGCSRGIG